MLRAGVSAQPPGGNQHRSLSVGPTTEQSSGIQQPLCHRRLTIDCRRLAMNRRPRSRTFLQNKQHLPSPEDPPAEHAPGGPARRGPRVATMFHSR